MGVDDLPTFLICLSHFLSEFLVSIPPPTVNFVVISAGTGRQAPGFLMENVMQAAHLLVPPQRLVNQPQGLQRIVNIREHFPFALEESRQQILIWKCECWNKRRCHEELANILRKL